MLTEAEFFIETLKFCLNVFILLPEALKMLRNVKSLPKSAAIDLRLLILKLEEQSLRHIGKNMMVFLKHMGIKIMFQMGLNP